MAVLSRAACASDKIGELIHHVVSFVTQVLARMELADPWVHAVLLAAGATRDGGGASGPLLQVPCAENADILSSSYPGFHKRGCTDLCN